MQSIKNETSVRFLETSAKRASSKQEAEDARDASFIEEFSTAAREMEPERAVSQEPAVTKEGPNEWELPAEAPEPEGPQLESALGSESGAAPPLEGALTTDPRAVPARGVQKVPAFNAVPGRSERVQPEGGGSAFPVSNTPLPSNPPRGRDPLGPSESPKLRPRVSTSEAAPQSGRTPPKEQRLSRELTTLRELLGISREARPTTGPETRETASVTPRREALVLESTSEWERSTERQEAQPSRFQKSTADVRSRDVPLKSSSTEKELDEPGRKAPEVTTSGARSGASSQEGAATWSPSVPTLRPMASGTPDVAAQTVAPQPAAAHPVTSPIGATSVKPLEAPSSLPPETVQSLHDQLRLRLNPNRSEITVILDPPNLGRLHVKLGIRAGELQARIIADRADVARTFEGDIARLHRTLEDAGLRVSHVEIRTSLQDASQEPQLFAGMQNSQAKEQQAQSTSRDARPPRRSRTQATEHASMERTDSEGVARSATLDLIV